MKMKRHRINHLFVYFLKVTLRHFNQPFHVGYSTIIIESICDINSSKTEVIIAMLAEFCRDKGMDSFVTVSFISFGITNFVEALTSVL